MKVVMLTRVASPFHIYGGMEKFVYYLSENLIKEGVDVTVVTSSNKSEVRKVNGIKYILIPPLVKYVHTSIPHSVRAAGLYFRYNLFNFAVAKRLKQRSFDVLHSYEMSAQRYLQFRNKSPTIVQAFDNELCKIEGWKRIFYYPSMQQLRYCMVNCDAIAAEGEFQIQEIMVLFGVNRRKIIIIPVGVDLSLAKESLETNYISREELGLSDNDFVLISVNRFSRVKGISYLVDAFRIVKSQVENAKLLLIGTGPEAGRIREQVCKLELTESVLHLGNLPESLLYNCYSLSDVYVSPTLHDDFIMGILEAMACGLPIISTGQSFVVHQGINGYVVSKKDPKGIASALLKMYDEDKCKVMGNMSRTIVKDYDWKIIARKAIKEYERLV